jgi:hypothetical protein
MNKHLSSKEIDLINFLHEHRLATEVEAKEYNTVNYLLSIEGDYLAMFESTANYHSDDRLTENEAKIIDTLYRKFYS